MEALDAAVVLNDQQTDYTHVVFIKKSLLNIYCVSRSPGNTLVSKSLAFMKFNLVILSA
jgi:hypothetical protein